jgi:hypothetical protein
MANAGSNATKHNTRFHHVVEHASMDRAKGFISRAHGVGAAGGAVPVSPIIARDARSQPRTLRTMRRSEKHHESRSRLRA